MTSCVMLREAVASRHPACAMGESEGAPRACPMAMGRRISRRGMKKKVVRRVDLEVVAGEEAALTRNVEMSVCGEELGEKW